MADKALNAATRDARGWHNAAGMLPTVRMAVDVNWFDGYWYATRQNTRSGRMVRSVGRLVAKLVMNVGAICIWRTAGPRKSASLAHSSQ